MPELLNPSNVLRKLIESMVDYTQTQDVKHYLTTFYGLYVAATDSEMRKLVMDEYYKRGNISSSPQVSEKIMNDIFTEFMETDEYFRNLHDRHARYRFMFGEFWYSWCSQQHEYIRLWMVEQGFVPVYTMEQAHEAAQSAKNKLCCSYHIQMNNLLWPEGDPFYLFQETAMVFVGTKQQIEDLIAYSEQQDFGCILKSAGKHASPGISK